jgi:hypothetical protein
MPLQRLFLNSFSELSDVPVEDRADLLDRARRLTFTDRRKSSIALIHLLLDTLVVLLVALLLPYFLGIRFPHSMWFVIPGLLVGAFMFRRAYGRLLRSALTQMLAERS